MSHMFSENNYYAFYYYIDRYKIKRPTCLDWSRD